MNKPMWNVLGIAVATMLAAACAAPADEADESVATEADALRIGSSGTGVKKQSDLEADGYTCKQWSGTTVTECTKFGHDTYTCDSAGRCTVLLVKRPTFPTAPIATVLAP